MVGRKKGEYAAVPGEARPRLGRRLQAGGRGMSSQCTNRPSLVRISHSVTRQHACENNLRLSPMLYPASHLAMGRAMESRARGQVARGNAGEGARGPRRHAFYDAREMHPVEVRPQASSLKRRNSPALRVQHGGSRARVSSERAPPENEKGDHRSPAGPMLEEKIPWSASVASAFPRPPPPAPPHSPRPLLASSFDISEPLPRGRSGRSRLGGGISLPPRLFSPFARGSLTPLTQNN